MYQLGRHTLGQLFRSPLTPLIRTGARQFATLAQNPTEAKKDLQHIKDLQKQAFQAWRDMAFGLCDTKLTKALKEVQKLPENKEVTQLEKELREQVRSAKNVNKKYDTDPEFRDMINALKKAQNEN